MEGNTEKHEQNPLRQQWVTLLKYLWASSWIPGRHRSGLRCSFFVHWKTRRGHLRSINALADLHCEVTRWEATHANTDVLLRLLSSLAPLATEVMMNWGVGKFKQCFPLVPQFYTFQQTLLKQLRGSRPLTWTASRVCFHLVHPGRFLPQLPVLIITKQQNNFKYPPDRMKLIAISPRNARLCIVK